MPRLLVSLPDAAAGEGAESERGFELTEPAVALGRLADNAVQVDDPSVSSHHAQFVRGASGNYVLKDLNSTNGTRVNGSHITEVLLRPGDRLRFGRIDAVYQSEISEADAPVQPLPDATAIAAQPAERSARPEDFTNASPFPKPVRETDPVGRAILIFAGVALVLFLAALAKVILLQSSLVPGGR